jgi:hypothetical protein
VTTDFHVAGHVTSSGGYNATAVTVAVDPTDNGTHKYHPDAQNFQGSKTTENFDVVVFPDFNGKYRVTVRGFGQSCFLGQCTGEGSNTITRAITVTVPPKTPTGFKASASDSKVTVEWAASANTEGDLLGFIVERLTPGSTVYGCIAAVPVDPERPATYKTVDDLKDQPSGDYRYHVKAVRAVNADTQMPTCGDQGGPVYSPTTNASRITWSNPTSTSTSTSTTAPGGGTGGTGGTGASTTTTRPKSATGGGSTASAGGSSGRPNLAALGSLGGANNLARTPSLAGGTEPDSGFNELLPFQSGNQGGGIDEGSAATPDTPLNAAEGGSGQTTTLLFIAAGLLATVLSMHVLWLKAQVDRMPLEPLAPQDIAVL